MSKKKRFMPKLDTETEDKSLGIDKFVKEMIDNVGLKGVRDVLFYDTTEKLIGKYGYKQLVVAIEELSELQKELCKALRGKAKVKSILEEVADVEIMIEQIKVYFDLHDKEIEEEIDTKIQRTIERCNLNEDN